MKNKVRITFLLFVFCLGFSLCNAISSQAIQPKVVSDISGFFALKSNGTLLLGGGDSSNRSVVNPIVEVTHSNGLPVTDIVDIAAGDSHRLALKSDGTVYAWGLNNEGQIGDGTGVDRTFPVLVRNSDGSALTNIKKVIARGIVSAAIKTDGTGLMWGWMHGYYPSQILNVDGAILTQISQIEIGTYNYYCLTDNGEIIAYGDNR